MATMTSALGSVETAVEAIKLGACDYLTKPVALSELKLVIDKAVGIERLASTLDHYHGEEAPRTSAPGARRGGTSSSRTPVR
jgi:two-component system response regulator AtoC